MRSRASTTVGLLLLAAGIVRGGLGGPESPPSSNSERGMAAHLHFVQPRQRVLAALGPHSRASEDDPPRLAPRVRRIVVHVLGGPAYDRPERRFRFFDPPQTQSRWKPRFGAHWIIWTDGSLWPRHARPAGPRSWTPDVDRPATKADRHRVATEAAPVYAHLHKGNSSSVGIELSHSGRARDPFPPAQVRSLAWLLRTLLELSDGRLTTADVYGHKDLDRRPAYLRSVCDRPGCPYFVDDQGRALRRRVDPPESLFAALAREGLMILRPMDGDADLRRAEAIAPGERPRATGPAPRSSQ